MRHLLDRLRHRVWYPLLDMIDIGVITMCDIGISLLRGNRAKDERKRFLVCYNTNSSGDSCNELQLLIRSDFDDTDLDVLRVLEVGDEYMTMSKMHAGWMISVKRTA